MLFPLIMEPQRSVRRPYYFFYVIGHVRDYVTGVRTPVSFVTSLDDVIELTMRKLRYNF